MSEAATAVHHRLRVHGSLGPLRLDVDLHLRADWTLLFGPSGSGKSTLLRAACGLLPTLDATLYRGPGSVALPARPRLRSLSYAPQQDALFPHLTVRQNIAFGNTGRSADAATVE